MADGLPLVLKHGLGSLARRHERWNRTFTRSVAQRSLPVKGLVFSLHDFHQIRIESKRVDAFLLKSRRRSPAYMDESCALQTAIGGLAHGRVHRIRNQP